MNKNYDILFTPFTVGNVHIKNRFVLCAMTGTALIDKGKFNNRVEPYYMDRANGGAGLIISGCMQVFDMFGRDMWATDHPEIFHVPIKKLVSDIHKTGAKFFMQLGAGLGRVARLEVAKQFKGTSPDKVRFAASRTPNVWDPETMHREITPEEIHKITEAMIETAFLCKEAGCDGVEIHAVHEGYLLDQFAIANTNKRTDEYGGSLENRLKFACDIVNGIKKKCGKYFAISMRFGVESKVKDFNRGALPEEEYKEFFRTKEESIKVAKILQNAGVDLLNADNGSYDSWYWAHPPVYMKEACNLDTAAFLKSHIDIPVVCAGRMENPDIASDAIGSGKIDAVGIARQLLADPEYPNKINAGKLEDIRPCIACHNGCLGSLLIGKGVGCALRPATMHEAKYEIRAAEKKKKVMIIGGGIGGMETARLATMRGHEAVLYEKTGKLGGAFIAASMPSFKESDRRLIHWYENELKKANVIVHMNTTATSDTVDEEKPDVLIIATGSIPKQLPISGIETSHVISAKELLMNGCRLDGDTVVVGGGLTGCEVAYELALHGTPVRIVEAASEIMGVKGLSMANRSMLADYLEYYNVEVYCNSTIERITEESVVIQHNEKTTVLPAKNVVLSIGFIPDTVQIQSSCVNETHVIGDAEKIGNLMTVIKRAYEVAMNL